MSSHLPALEHGTRPSPRPRFPALSRWQAPERAPEGASPTAGTERAPLRRRGGLGLTMCLERERLRQLWVRGAATSVRPSASPALSTWEARCRALSGDIQTQVWHGWGQARGNATLWPLCLLRGPGTLQCHLVPAWHLPPVSVSSLVLHATAHSSQGPSPRQRPLPAPCGGPSMLK